MLYVPCRSHGVFHDTKLCENQNYSVDGVGFIVLSELFDFIFYHAGSLYSMCDARELLFHCLELGEYRIELLSHLLVRIRPYKSIFV